MPALVLKSIPEQLHSRLKQSAAMHRRSMTQEAIILLETALTLPPSTASSPMSRRVLLPEYEAFLQQPARDFGSLDIQEEDHALRNL